MSAPHWMSVPAHYRPTSETGGWIIGGERGHGDGVLMAAARLSELGKGYFGKDRRGKEVPFLVSPRKCPQCLPLSPLVS